MERWEYKIINSDDLDGYHFQEDYFNSLGKEGWELVTGVKDYFYFKRRKQEDYR